MVESKFSNPKNYGEKEQPRAAQTENEAADTLAKEGIWCWANSPPNGNGKWPDYKVEGEYANCYSPEPKSDVDSAYRKIKDKVDSDQTDIIVVNTTDAHKIDAEALGKVIDKDPISGLKKLL